MLFDRGGVLGKADEPGHCAAGSEKIISGADNVFPDVSHGVENSEPAGVGVVDRVAADVHVGVGVLAAGVALGPALDVGVVVALAVVDEAGGVLVAVGVGPGVGLGAGGGEDLAVGVVAVGADGGAAAVGDGGDGAETVGE